MAEQTSANNARPRNWPRILARILSVPILAFMIFMVVGHILFPEPTVEDYPPIENLLPVIMTLSVLGLALAWKWEGLGAMVCLILFVAEFALYWVIRGKFFPLQMLPIFSPVPITAVLFLLSWRTTRLSKESS